jgi:hypothetical protein
VRINADHHKEIAMLTIEAHTKLTPNQTIEKAAQFFAGGYGLTIKGKTDNEILLEGGGGGVDVSACDDEKGSTVQVVSREWDNQAKDFLMSIKA